MRRIGDIFFLFLFVVFAVIALFSKDDSKTHSPHQS